MMKQVFFLALTLLLLAGCSVPQDKDIVQNEPDSQEVTLVNREDFIIDTFKEYGYDAPEASKWTVKEEGAQKVVVIIKDNLDGPGKPSIHKLIFDWDEVSGKGVLHFVMVDNQVKFGKEN